MHHVRTKISGGRAALFAAMNRSARGASVIEYALLLALIAMVCFGAIVFLGNDTSEGLSVTGSRVGNL